MITDMKDTSNCVTFSGEADIFLKAIKFTLDLHGGQYNKQKIPLTCIKGGSERLV